MEGKTGHLLAYRLKASSSAVHTRRRNRSQTSSSPWVCCINCKTMSSISSEISSASKRHQTCTKARCLLVIADSLLHPHCAKNCGVCSRPRATKFSAMMNRTIERFRHDGTRCGLEEMRTLRDRFLANEWASSPHSHTSSFTLHCVPYRGFGNEPSPQPHRRVRRL